MTTGRINQVAPLTDKSVSLARYHKVPRISTSIPRNEGNNALKCHKGDVPLPSLTPNVTALQSTLNSQNIPYDS
jgi:hypothetical protein